MLGAQLVAPGDLKMWVAQFISNQGPADGEGPWVKARQNIRIFHIREKPKLSFIALASPLISPTNDLQLEFQGSVYSHGLWGRDRILWFSSQG